LISGGDLKNYKNTDHEIKQRGCSRFLFATGNDVNGNGYGYRE
jgi:hypothetical protein